MKTKIACGILTFCLLISFSLAAENLLKSEKSEPKDLLNSLDHKELALSRSVTITLVIPPRNKRNALTLKKIKEGQLKVEDAAITTQKK